MAGRVLQTSLVRGPSLGLGLLLRTDSGLRHQHSLHPLFADPETAPVSPKVHDSFDAAKPDAAADTLYGKTNVFVREARTHLPRLCTIRLDAPLPSALSVCKQQTAPAQGRGTGRGGVLARGCVPRRAAQHARVQGGAGRAGATGTRLPRAAAEDAADAAAGGARGAHHHARQVAQGPANFPLHCKALLQAWPPAPTAGLALDANVTLPRSWAA
jgi:hypothetical protein